MGVRRLFSRGGQKFSRGGGKNLLFAKKTTKKILFIPKKSKNMLFLAGLGRQGGGARGPPSPLDAHNYRQLQVKRGLMRS